jgi:hypothetical protein
MKPIVVTSSLVVGASGVALAAGCYPIAEREVGYDYRFSTLYLYDKCRSM